MASSSDEILSLQAEQLLRPEPDQAELLRATSSGDLSTTQTLNNSSLSQSSLLHRQKDAQTEQQPDQDGKSASSLTLWKWELFYMCSSVGALLAIVSVLFAYSGEPLNSWHAPLRPNTVVSALSTLSKSAVAMVLGQGIGQLKWVYFEQRPHRLSDFEVFDGASRGPLGALQLLYGINWRASMASVGATLTLLSLAIDPFVQQVISYEQRLLLDPRKNSTLYTTRAYDTGSRAQPSYMDFFARLDASTHMDLASALYNGAFAMEPMKSFSCPSGNCTWSAFESLAVCSQCRDVTLEVTQAANCFATDINGTLLSDEDREDHWERWCSYNFTTGAQLERKCPNENTRWISGGGNDPIHTIWNSSLTANDDLFGNGTFARLSTIRFQPEDVGSGSDSFSSALEMNCSQPLDRAFDCTLSWCVHSYGAAVAKDNSLSNLPIRTEQLVFPDYSPGGGQHEGPWWKFWGKDKNDAHNWNPNMEDTSYILGAFRPADVPHLNVSQNGPSSYDQVKDDPRAFFVNIGDNMEVVNVLSTSLTTSLEQASPEGQDGLARALYTADDFPKRMNAIAQAFTTVIRQGPNSTMVPGKAYVVEQFIVVHWAWLTMPALLVFFGIGFLAASMIFAAEKHRAVWKSSTMPTLFHGLSGWSDEELRAMRLDEMDRLAKGMYAQCEPAQKGIVKLVRHEI